MNELGAKFELHFTTRCETPTPKDNDDLIDETKSDMHVLSYCEDNLKAAQETTFKSDWQLGLFPGPISIEMVHVEQDVDFDDELQRSVGGENSEQFLLGDILKGVFCICN